MFKQLPSSRNNKYHIKVKEKNKVLCQSKDIMERTI